MAEKKRIRHVKIELEAGTFRAFFRRARNMPNLSGLAELRSLLSNERAKILYAVKLYKPKSLYELSRLLDRDFKSVRKDIRLLEKFGFLRLRPGAKGKRKLLKPVLAVDAVDILVEI